MPAQECLCVGTIQSRETLKKVMKRGVFEIGTRLEYVCVAQHTELAGSGVGLRSLINRCDDFFQVAAAIAQAQSGFSKLIA